MWRMYNLGDIGREVGFDLIWDKVKEEMSGLKEGEDFKKTQRKVAF